MGSLDNVPDSRDFSFPGNEVHVLALWKDLDAFKEQLRRSEGKPEYVFYDGPPFATGLPHYGHILAGTIKDIVTRYACSDGYHVTRRFGWDCHGLPVEYEIDKKLNITSRDQVMAMGIDKYNEECRSIVMRYSKEWERTVVRLGRWIDFENDYKTLDPSFMESVWWVFKQLFSKGLVYKGFKVMPYSTACTTSLSNFEVGLNYKDVQDPAVIVSFPLVGEADGASMVAWTTTPWTLPSNLSLCVHPDFDYVKCRDPATGKVYILAEARLSVIPGAVPKKGKGKGKKDKKQEAAGFEILDKFKGSTLVGRSYEPLFGYFASFADKGGFRVVADTYVTDDAGTGVVHQAPAFGEDDFRVCMANGVLEKGGAIPDPIDVNGRFSEVVSDFAGQHVKQADKGIIQKLRQAGRLVDAAIITHSYPYCWRSETPLIYKAVPSWFVKVESFKDRLVKNNNQTYWVPSYVKEKRFHNWLENAHDWAISRSRYWGTPMPVWMSEDGDEVVVVGSIAELEELSGVRVTDLHRHFVDKIEIPSKQGKGSLKRVDDVFDCWFESGSMPYAQQHYPFENKEAFESRFPANFIAEGIDQTRGWFYTLTVLSTALFDKPPFRNLICNGLVLASDGKKMSKRLKNYPDPTKVIDAYGADALRLYLVNSPVVRAESLRFKEEGVLAVVKDVFLPWYNAYRFFVQNAKRAEDDGGVSFSPASVDLAQATNVLDRWMIAATTSLAAYVKREMEAYRLYTVLPYLVKFINNLTNVYVRFNRKRLKGQKGGEDCQMALAVLFDALLVLCKVMAPFTPFLTETMYQNLRKCSPGLSESVHWEPFPDPAQRQKADERIQLSVARMQTVIETARVIRDRKSRPVKLPLKQMTVVHPDPDFVSDLMGELRVYLEEEINVREIESSTDVSKHASVSAEPEWGILGKKHGKQMGAIAKAIKALGSAEIAELEAGREVEVCGVYVGRGEVKVVRTFQPPEGSDPADLDAHGDGDVLVVLDLRLDEGLVAAGTAREVVNRIQKLRKKAGLEPSDKIEFFYELGEDEGSAALAKVFESQAEYFVSAVGTRPLPSSQRPAHSVSIASETCQVGDAQEFTAVLARPAVKPLAAMAELCAGTGVTEDDLVTWLASLDLERVRKEKADLKVNLDGKAICLALGKHFE